MGIAPLFGLKIYNNVYVKGYSSFPYQLLTGRNTLLYKGKIICGIDKKPKEFIEEKDLFIGCDCDFPKWRNLKRVL